ncbi:MAG: peptide deformylase [Succinivibrio sp.]
MAVREVVIYPDEILRRPNAKITEFNDELKTLANDMFDTMYEHEGIGLAGPQIGVNRQIVVIDIPEEDGKQGNNQLVIINPVITKLEGDIVESEEGCLSVPGYQDKVSRYSRCTVEYQDITGKNCVFDNVDGLFAICLQHEIDHLNGKVFVDKLSRLKIERLHKKYEKILKENKRSK